MTTLKLKKGLSTRPVVAKSNTVSNLVAIQARQREMGKKPTTIVAYVSKEKTSCSS